MSRFFSQKYSELTPYVPGEQPRDRKYIKLNTNESPFPPSDKVLKAVASEAESLNLYSDPEMLELRKKLAETYDVGINNIVCTNGSDEALNFIFMAFGDKGFVFPDLTYGFYPVFCKLNGIRYREIPLKDDFSIDLSDYIEAKENIVIANPNAPTGLMLTAKEIERLTISNPERIVVIDEAYVDFGGESAVERTKKYSNLIVVGTFSKSRSLAGGRLGFAIANEELISDLNTLRFSTNPYNVNRMTLSAGIAALEDADYYKRNCEIIMENRDYTAEKLQKLGFEVVPSKTNFLLAKSDNISGSELYEKLKERGILVRHFNIPRISDYNRITIGTREQMDMFILKTEEIINEKR